MSRSSDAEASACSSDSRYGWPLSGDDEAAARQAHAALHAGGAASKGRRLDGRGRPCGALPGRPIAPGCPAQARRAWRGPS